MHRFHIPEIFLGCLLTVAVFSVGLLFNGQQSAPPQHAEKHQNASARSNKPENPDSELTGSTWITKDAAGFFTFGLVVVGIGQAVLFLVQLRYMRRGMEDTTTAANAARDGARAARDSADVSKIAMVAGERAYVHHAGCRAISHLNPANATVFWRIRPLWTNAGNTPARKAEIYAHYELRDSPLPPEYAFTRQELPLTETMIAAGAVIESGPRDLSGQELLDIAAGRKFFYIWGIARYRDVFPETPERVTKFCVQALTITGNPMVGWDANNNPLEIVFIGFHRHYCMDEDC